MIFRGYDGFSVLCLKGGNFRGRFMQHKYVFIFLSLLASLSTPSMESHWASHHIVIVLGDWNNPSLVVMHGLSSIHLISYFVCPKVLQIYMQFIEGEVESDTNSDIEDGDSVRNLNEADVLDGGSLSLSEQVISSLAFVVIKDIQAMGKGVVIYSCILF